MPTYQYACTACDQRLEAVQSFTDAPLTECTACGGALRKVFSAVGVVFKGSGFYKTDSRGAKGSSDASKADTKADSGSGDTAKASTSGSSTDNGSGGGKGSSPSSTPASTSASSAPASKSA